MEKKTLEEKFPHDMKVVSIEEEQLKSNQKIEVEQNLRILDQLDSINVPMDIKIYTGEKPWNYRNKAWREMVNKSDIEMRKRMQEFLKS